MITRISTLVAIVVSGGILFSVGSPALAKGAGVNNGSISIKREAKLVRVIRVKLARRIAVEKPVAIIEAGRGNGNETLVSRFRRSHHFAARTFANVGNKGTLASLWF